MGLSIRDLNAEAALQHSSLGGQLEAAGLPAWSVLAVALVEVRHGEGAHEWREYAQALPSSTGCVLEWSEDEVSIPKGTSNTATSVSQLAEYDLQCSQVLSFRVDESS